MGPLLIDEIERLRREVGAMSARVAILLVLALARPLRRLAAAAVRAAAGPVRAGSQASPVWC